MDVDRSIAVDPESGSDFTFATAESADADVVAAAAEDADAAMAVAGVAMASADDMGLTFNDVTWKLASAKLVSFQFQLLPFKFDDEDEQCFACFPSANSAD